MTGIIIPNNGTIGSASDTDAISIASDGNVTLSQTNPTLTLGSNATISKSGMIVNSKIVENAQRTTIASVANADAELIAFGNYTKLLANTDLFIQVNVFMWNTSTQWTGNIGVKYGSSGTTYWAQSYPYTDLTKGNQMTIYAKINGHTTIGEQAISIRYGRSGTSSTRPAEIINPNSGEDDRINNSGKSVAIVYEVNT